MSEYTPNPSEPPTIEEGVYALFDDAKKTLKEKYHQCEACVSESPTKAMIAAVAAGYVLHRLPIRSIVVANVRLVSALAGPALLAFGAAKACEFLQKEARKHAE
ncbi:hypothetical protein JIN85_04710 [Luteolibacter pohnpeiensis]|uniref:Uncharacterized protein n=1 Tax=Luteolibacter pohnpeiensis TaxID=454153 RepID=A0A934S3M0_9BACT|nr:hypothetical protein [Luteolibacter pohnpeiensis]MBK1881702.1 hypothetical protein [Luteolibacter pohnpeiensis]